MPLPAGYYTLDDAPVYFNGELLLIQAPLPPCAIPHVTKLSSSPFSS